MSAVAAAPRPGLGTLIAAVLLPPLAIYFVRGLGPAFWIGVLATLIGWVPGVLFAVLVVLRPNVAGRF